MASTSVNMRCKVRSHRRKWIELIPIRDGATLRQQEPEPEEIHWNGGPLIRAEETYRDYEFSTRDFEIIVHDEPTENLKKITDLGYKEGAACRILDALGLD